MRALVVVAMLASLLLTTPAAAEDLPPVVSNPVINPADLPPAGGTVTVSADVTDDISVSSVGASAYGPESLSVPMVLTDPDAGTYTGSFDIGPNFSEEPAGYQIEIVAVDGASGTTIEIVGAVEVAGRPPFDEKPIVWDPSVSPTSLPAGGGPVSLAVSATDLRGISEAYASIAGPGGAAYQVPLEPTGGNRFSGVFEAPANTSGTPAVYAIEFSALDDIGQQTTVSGAPVTVAARAAGRLKLKPGERRFGKVRRGKVARRTIVVKHVGAEGTVSGVVETSGAPFFVAGRSAAFELEPGESKRFRVEFRPTARGRFTGRVDVVRDDGRQPGLHATLRGRGT
jgi:hypothetical protein